MFTKSLFCQTTKIRLHLPSTHHDPGANGRKVMVSDAFLNDIKSLSSQNSAPFILNTQIMICIVSIRWVKNLYLTKTVAMMSSQNYVEVAE